MFILTRPAPRAPVRAFHQAASFSHRLETRLLGEGVPGLATTKRSVGWAGESGVDCNPIGGREGEK